MCPSEPNNQSHPPPSISKKYRLKYGQIVARDETDDGSGFSISPWLVRFIVILFVLGTIVELLIK